MMIVDVWFAAAANFPATGPLINRAHCCMLQRLHVHAARSMETQSFAFDAAPEAFSQPQNCAACA